MKFKNHIRSQKVSGCRILYVLVLEISHCFTGEKNDFIPALLSVPKKKKGRQEPRRKNFAAELRLGSQEQKQAL